MSINCISKHKVSSSQVSIIVATYNSELFIVETLKSIVDQGILGLEIILVDGASSDRTLELVRGMGIENMRIISEPDRGIGDAWNKGLKISTGSIIGMLNSDDYYAQNMLKGVLAELIDHDEPLIGFGDVILVNPITQKTQRIEGKMRGRLGLLNGFGFLHPSVFFNRKALEKVGYFNAKINVAVDTDWLLRAISCGVKFKKISSLVYMRTGGISDANKHTGMGEFADALVRNGYSEFQMLVFFMLRFLGRLRQFFRWE